jgi:hypothetical protein
MKLNGWKRIGIIASAVWVIWSYNHTFDRMEFVTSSIAVDQEQRCLSAHPGEFDKYFPQCDAVGETNGQMQLRQKERHNNQVAAAMEALVPVPLAWGFAYLVLLLVRWVKRGFGS